MGRFIEEDHAWCLDHSTAKEHHLLLPVGEVEEVVAVGAAPRGTCLSRVLDERGGERSDEVFEGKAFDPLLGDESVTVVFHRLILGRRGRRRRRRRRESEERKGWEKDEETERGEGEGVREGGRMRNERDGWRRRGRIEMCGVGRQSVRSRTGTSLVDPFSSFSPTV